MDNPFSLGDLHRGYRVLGTTPDYFKYYRYGEKRNLRFSNGDVFDDVFDAVLGADVAEKLSYGVGDPLVVTHGISKRGGTEHADKPFRISGILAKTGTPVDQTIHVSLAGIEAIHIDWRGGARVPGFTITADEVRGLNLQPKAITAFLVGLNSRLDAFRVQRRINTYGREPLTAILPGVALHELWRVLGTAETALSVISFFVIATSLLGMLTVMLAGVNERRKEFAILRSVGAGTRHIFALHLIEALFLTAARVIIGTSLLYGLLLITQPIIEDQYGLFINIRALTQGDLLRMTLVLTAGVVARNGAGVAGLRKHARGWTHRPALIGDTLERLLPPANPQPRLALARVSASLRCSLIDQNLAVCACSIGDDLTRSLDLRDTVKSLGILLHQ